MAKVSHVLAIINVHSQVQTAAQRAADLARRLGARLTLAAIVYQPEAAFDLFHMVDSDQVRKSYVEEAMGKLATVTRELGLDPAQVSGHAFWLHPFDSGALHAIDELDADLLVVAARDESGRRFSHAEWRLIHASAIPVLMARPRGWAEPAVIAACVDPGHHGDEDARVDQRVLDIACILDGKAGNLEILHALGELPDAIGVAQNPADYERDLRTSREKKIRALLPAAKKEAVRVNMPALDPVDAIENFCRTRPVDLLVMGVFARSRLSDILIGSTARKILPSMPCDVLAVPETMRKNGKEVKK